jgi:starch synthase
VKILFVTSEAAPLMKTGGLADVSSSLPGALASLGHEVHILMPAYRDTLARADGPTQVATLRLDGLPEPVGILEAAMPDTGVAVWLIDYPPFFDRPGNPYVDTNATEWPDNPARFALLGRVAAAIARGSAGFVWRPDVLHCNDWQSGLAPALLAGAPSRPATLFTIHNLAYQGVYPWETFASLGLPGELWSVDGLEFYGQMSFIKGGLVFADWLTTVSPTYAREIQTPEFGFGLDGLLRHRADRLRGILNGADYGIWDPATDPLIGTRYDADQLAGKQANKRALLAEVGLPDDTDTPLLGMITRLVDQKGVDLVIEALPRVLEQPAKLVVLGSGNPHHEEAVRHLATRFPEQVAVRLGYNETLAHRIESGADMFLMPSRFEPCGLNQIYSLRYGTLPIVRRTGGLADTVVDANPDSMAAGAATGFVFDQPSPEALLEAVRRALALYADPGAWRGMMLTAMAQDFSWERSAAEYVALYEIALAKTAPVA